MTVDKPQLQVKALSQPTFLKGQEVTQKGNNTSQFYHESIAYPFAQFTVKKNGFFIENSEYFENIHFVERTGMVSFIYLLFFCYDQSKYYWVFYIFALLKRFSDEKTFSQCHLTKMKMITTKATLLNFFRGIYYSQHNIVPILTILLFNKKSIYYTNLQKKRGKK